MAWVAAADAASLPSSKPSLPALVDRCMQLQLPGAPLCSVPSTCGCVQCVRRSLLPALAGRCVRLQQMQLSELELLDQHPEVVACEAATRVVAGMYLSRIMDTSAAPYTAAKHPRPAYAAKKKLHRAGLLVL